TQGSSVVTLLDILCFEGNSLLIGAGLPLQQEAGARSMLSTISPSLFHGNVGPTAMSLPSTSSAYINVVATFAAAGVDFCTAFSLHMIGKFLYFLPSVGRVASTASLHCTLPTAVATSSAKSSPSSPASPLLAALQ
ncbi:hypothetical protein BHE74_00055880, partial [Ensete ventricosum]